MKTARGNGPRERDRLARIPFPPPGPHGLSLLSAAYQPARKPPSGARGSVEVGGRGGYGWMGMRLARRAGDERRGGAVAVAVRILPSEPAHQIRANIEHSRGGTLI